MSCSTKPIKNGLASIFKVIAIITITSAISVPHASTSNGARAELVDADHALRILPRAPQTSFDWQKLNPSPNLVWVECFAGRQCARFEVPLDYTNPNGDKVAIALLRIKSKVASDSKNYRGPVLFNPGGPGGSGVDFVNQFGENYQRILGDEHDIVGFDPRGIGQTTPAVLVFQDLAEKASWEAGAPPLLNSTPDSLPRAFARAQVFNALAAARNGQIAQHVGTAAVARDMLSIVRAHGSERLQYYGFSYGSVLGATYAAMFPDHVERLVIDGVVDFDDYYSDLQAKSLLDADKALNILYEKCAGAGPACPIHADSADLVRQRVNAILASVKAQPVSAVTGPDYGIIDFTDVKRALYESVRSPFTSYPPIAAALAALEQGDGAPAVAVLRAFMPVPTCSGAPAGAIQGQEGGAAVSCGDAARVPTTAADVMARFDTLSKTSVFADVWTENVFTICVGWQVRAKERFDGPFNVNTSFPLLVIGNTADPVTPIIGAQKAVRAFTGSALLTLDTPGHTTIAANSSCAEGVVHDYFAKGQLPDQGKVCEVDNVLFGQKFATPGNSTTTLKF